MALYEKHREEKHQKAEIEAINPIKAAESAKRTIKKPVKAETEKPNKPAADSNITLGGSSQTLSESISIEQPTQAPAKASGATQPREFSAATPALYASTTLETYETTIDDAYLPEEIIINDVTHQRVDAQYFAYLLEKMEKATKAYQDGRIEGKYLAIALAKFVKIELWVLDHVGEKGITGAIAERKNGGGYRAEYSRRLSVVRDLSEPREPGHLFPMDGPWRYTHPVDHHPLTRSTKFGTKLWLSDGLKLSCIRIVGCLNSRWDRDGAWSA